ncbi:L-2-amino-thiazoline-4-carboxylic acid hydrolase [Capnocytophaga catalasegens]|uniref:L-2-amino-thiazoline-4-carboxylic acid hydrolase n=1 Tax=Capnocytophaga catalasegens TaxID=1004260 RepID=A0AAV5AUT8_9FLAO|nr:L-2-amino-thiazoline-4-carboxylic acid hydrolase [Capnocytophaga catalasegens]GIZ16246.1 hypothetical protein RCZ03_22460 [Capnocytophaga catalasegens]GJM51134.1 hypothetical protein RCZ15_21070 [Capnocytophaga catalasegens]GJM53324.1 hypothetical protein RCZ16_16410 [Capnocytophaga catalasegens]
MESKNTPYKGYDFSPLEVFEWIKHGTFEYILAKNWLTTTDFETFKTTFEERFLQNFIQVKSLISNKLDEGNISFVLLIVSLYEAFLAVGVCEEYALQYTEESVCWPIFPFMQEGTEKMPDNAENPFKSLVLSSKTREKEYFGDSFDFERPIDDEFGYVLRIKKCLFHETLKILHRVELQNIVCRIDLGWIKGIKPYKVRPVTFTSGNICQMWFMREEKL